MTTRTYNDAYGPYFMHEGRYPVVYGGAGSGKSYAIAQKHVWRAVTTPHERFLFVRKVKRTCRESTFQLTRDIIADWGVANVNVNKSDLSITFPNGSEILHAGLDDVEKLKSIAGVTSIWIEEATEVTEDDFHQVDLRLRGSCPTYQQITLSFNPVNQLHWIKRELVDSQKATMVLRTTHRDNEYVDERYRRTLEALPADLRQVYEAGEWGAGVKGLIYPEWNTYSLPADGFDAYGLDFGYNAPSALVGIQVIDPVIKVQELLYEPHLTNADLIERLKEIVVDKHTPIYCDTAEPARIEEMGRAGLAAYASDKSITDGIDTVKRYDLRIHTGSTNLQNEIREYRWDEDRKTGELRDDRPVKHNDHLMDAMRYAIHNHCGQTVAQWGAW